MKPTVWAAFAIVWLGLRVGTAVPGGFKKSSVMTSKRTPNTMMTSNCQDSMKPPGSMNQNRYFAACESTWNFPLRRWVKNKQQQGPA